MKKISKENFLQVVSSLSREEINSIIKEKGKPPKMIDILIKTRKGDK